MKAADINKKEIEFEKEKTKAAQAAQLTAQAQMNAKANEHKEIELTIAKPLDPAEQYLEQFAKTPVKHSKTMNNTKAQIGKEAPPAT